MNQRIRLMAMASKAFTESRVTEPEVTQFMELIVRECIHLSKEVPLEGPVHKFTNEYEDGFWDAIDLYRKHIENRFGIK